MQSTPTPTDLHDEPNSAAKAPTGVSGASRPGQLRADRRHVVQLIASGVVGAFAGSAFAAGKAEAADGEAVLQGMTNAATQATVLTATGDTALVLTSDSGYGLDADGMFGNARFVSAGNAPVGQPAWAGTLWVDAAGDWWGATSSSDIDGQWRKLAGPGTAGALHVLATPVRVYDSRPGQAPAGVGPKSPLAANTPRPIDVKQNSSGVLATSRAVLITLTATNTGAPGFVTVWPQGPWPGTSSVNFSASAQTIATTTVVGLANGATFLAQSNTTTDLLVDVIGYYH